MPTEAGLPGWFPEDFSTDPALLDAFEDAADWHDAGNPAQARARSRNQDRYTWQPGDIKTGGGSAQDGQQHVASLRRLAAHGTPAQKKAAAAVLARTGATHDHANTWDDVMAVVELAAATAPAGQQGGGTLPPRVPAGSSAGGQFGAAQGSQKAPAAKGKAAPAKARAPAKPAAKKPLTGVAAQKATLMQRAKADQVQAAALGVKIKAAQAQMTALAKSSAASTASNTSATASTGQTASTSNVTATSAPAASTSTASTAPAAASTPAVTTSSLAAQIAGWQGQVKTLLASAAQATAQASKL